MQQSQIPHRRNSLSQSQASSAQQRMSGSTIEKPMYRGSGGETLPAGYGPSRQEKAQGPAPVHHNPPDVHHLHSHPHSEIESKWEMPSKEIPSGARQGVGSLPGERGEIGVALLPGEGGLGMQPSMKGVDAKGGMKGVGMGAGISKAGGGGRSGMSMGHGIRGGMKASMSGMRAARMEASIRHSIGSKAHLHPHLHAQSHTHPQARGHLEQGEQERKQPAAKLKGPPPTNLMPQITYHRTLSTSGAELPLHEVPTMSHAGCGSLPGPNTEAGVAVLPDERKFLKGLIKEIGARKAMKGQEVVFDSGVGIKKGGVGKAPKSVNAPTYPPTAPLLPLETYGNTLPIDGSEMPLHEVPSRPHKFGCGSLPGSMGEVGVAVVPDERMGISELFSSFYFILVLGGAGGVLGVR
ncbi:hypothetical protein BDQ17DRAFT_391960 [Cyathus striatus]|nr:hypothetical protein BDQ17DRAFT_391960 [Cyathus striatus]